MTDVNESKLVVDLDPATAATLTFQDYSPKPTIEGVFNVPMRKFRQLEGSLMEYMRVTDGKIDGFPVDFEVRQISISTTAPGRINAFHLHPKQVQDDVWCVIAGDMMAWLVDVRQDSPTLGVKACYVLSGENPSMLRIPTGVAHGYKTGSAGATMVYVMNAQFDPDNPNEGRLPWDYFGADIWSEDRG